GDDLEPVDRRPRLEHVTVVRRPQSDAEPEGAKIAAQAGHGRHARAGRPRGRPARHNHFTTTLPPLALQSASLVMIQPLPLQEFCPAQLWSAVPHDPLPLQSLPPMHLTLAASPPPAVSAALATCPAKKRPATAVAINAPFARLFTSVLLWLRVLGPTRAPCARAVAHKYVRGSSSDAPAHTDGPSSPAGVRSDTGSLLLIAHMD